MQKVIWMELDFTMKIKNFLLPIKKSSHIWCQTSGWFYVIISLLGNLFPLWFKALINYINGQTLRQSLSSFDSPFSFLLISISLSSMTVYLWLKNLKLDSSNFEKNSNILKYALMMIYILIIFPLWGYFISQEENINLRSGNYSLLIYILSCIVAFVYIYFQLKDFSENKKSEASNNLFIKKVEEKEINDLDKQLNSRLK